MRLVFICVCFFAFFGCPSTHEQPNPIPPASANIVEDISNLPEGPLSLEQQIGRIKALKAKNARLNLIVGRRSDEYPNEYPLPKIPGTFWVYSDILASTMNTAKNPIGLKIDVNNVVKMSELPAETFSKVLVDFGVIQYLILPLFAKNVFRLVEPQGSVYFEKPIETARSEIYYPAGNLLPYAFDWEGSNAHRGSTDVLKGISDVHRQQEKDAESRLVRKLFSSVAEASVTLHLHERYPIDNRSTAKSPVSYYEVKKNSGNRSSIETLSEHPSRGPGDIYRLEKQKKELRLILGRSSDDAGALQLPNIPNGEWVFMNRYATTRQAPTDPIQLTQHPEGFFLSLGFWLQPWSGRYSQIFLASTGLDIYPRVLLQVKLISNALKSGGKFFFKLPPTGVFDPLPGEDALEHKFDTKDPGPDALIYAIAVNYRFVLNDLAKAHSAESAARAEQIKRFTDYLKKNGFSNVIVHNNEAFVFPEEPDEKVTYIEAVK